jgi:hypothetical protein
MTQDELEDAVTLGVEPDEPEEVGVMYRVAPAIAYARAFAAWQDMVDTYCGD